MPKGRKKDEMISRKEAIKKLKTLKAATAAAEIVETKAWKKVYALEKKFSSSMDTGNKEKSALERAVLAAKSASSKWSMAMTAETVARDAYKPILEPVFTIKTDGNIVTIIDLISGKILARYKDIHPVSFVREWTKAINKHLASGGTLGNYQW
jgi:hypothetical protein